MIKLEIAEADICEQAVDAIVNAANSQLMHAGGVAAVIARRAGTELIEDSKRIAPVPLGQAKATRAGNLPCKHVIHAVGPVWDEDEAEHCDRMLASAYRSALEVAGELEAKTVAFPSISTGIFGFPVKRAAPIALKTVKQAAPPCGVELVRFCLIHQRDLDAYRTALAQLS